jgi:hypothetical protein
MRKETHKSILHTDNPGYTPNKYYQLILTINKENKAEKGEPFQQMLLEDLDIHM